jgi:hypothetical protein
MLSTKQQAFLDYLLERLGYTDKSFTDAYIEKLRQTAGIFRLFRGEMKEIVEEKDPPLPEAAEETPYTEATKAEVREVYYIPKTYSIIDYVVDEYNLKRKKQVSQKNATNDSYISATDLANFDFCPASYAISKTWEVEPNLLSIKGTQGHSQNRVLSLKETVSSDYDPNETKLDPQVKTFLKDIKNSVVVYSGHNEKEKTKFFKNSKSNYIGQPDYIFDNGGCKFIVEEKFRFKGKNRNYSFSDSHKTQLYSYIFGLDEFEISYGYLIYWDYAEYDYFYDSPGDLKFLQVLKLYKNESARKKLNSLYERINELKKNKTLNFDHTKLNPNKCASCVTGRLCGHKTGRYSSLEFPYEEKYLKIYPASFPEVLKKE